MSYVYSSAPDVRRSTDDPALFLASFGLLEFPCTDIVQMGKRIRPTQDSCQTVKTRHL